MPGRRALQWLVDVHTRVTRTLRLDSKPWLHWVIVYVVLLTYFLIFRCVALSAMFSIFGTVKEDSSANRTGAVFVGILEDFLLISVVLMLLSAVDKWLGPASTTKWVWTRRCGRAFFHVLFLVVVAILSFAADMILIRSRNLRFTFAFVTTYVREFKFTAGFEVSEREISIARQTASISATVGVVVVIFSLLWLDFSQWHPAKPLLNRTQLDKSRKTIGEDISDLEGGHSTASTPKSDTPRSPYAVHTEEREGAAVQVKTRISKPKIKRVAIAIAVPLVLLVLLSTTTLLITHSVSAVVSAAALNCSLNELFRLLFGLEFLHSLGDGTIESAELYVDAETESFTLFKDDVLFRNTTGFQGPLAFDVDVDAANPPNVVVIAIESFRYQDSLYLVRDKPAVVKKQGNVTLTPEFDRWAKRGVAFSNFWSAWQTSRSVEGILFGQVPYDHVSDSGTTTGRAKVELHGMPQLFKSKGYATAFTTGARLNYDGWDKFFGPHGFESVQGAVEMTEYAEQHYGITKEDWKQPSEGGKGRSLYWGVHDDVSFDVLGDMLINKTAEQAKRVADKQPKQPVFVNHYTISSHTPWLEHPEWFNNITLPDFTPLYQDLRRRRGTVQDYAKMRYFTDMELGKFLDRMDAAGVLNDTIVIIVGDHGQSPESSGTRAYADEIATTRVAAAIIAEGRLGKHAGLLVGDAAHQHDLLNTIADIVGVPASGFLQSSVGRSLKRTAAMDKRLVWSNNPMMRMAVVKGHRRFSYDRVFNMKGLYDVDEDPLEENDLWDTLSEEEKNEWETLRDRGRRLSRYFRLRWDNKCISKVEC